MQALRLLLIAMAVVNAGPALAADWQYAGAPGNDHAFFDSDSVKRTGTGSLSVRLKIISAETLTTHYFRNEQVLRRKAAQRLAAGRVPQFIQLESVRQDYSRNSRYGDAVGLEAATNVMAAQEVQANEFDISPRIRVDLELDCKAKRIRTANFAAFDETGRQVKSASGDRAWQAIQPGSLGEGLSLMLCKDRR